MVPWRWRSSGHKPQDEDEWTWERSSQRHEAVVRRSPRSTCPDCRCVIIMVRTGSPGRSILENFVPQLHDVAKTGARPPSSSWGFCSKLLHRHGTIPHELLLKMSRWENIPIGHPLSVQDGQGRGLAYHERYGGASGAPW